jgi:ribosome-associated toxin RatA of RatAB toxin-antitoxin module
MGGMDILRQSVNSLFSIRVKSLTHTLLLSCLLLLPVLLSTRVAAAQTQSQTQTQSPPQITVRQEGNILTVEGNMVTSLTHLNAWVVLTDYARFPEFVPGINSNRVMEQRKDFKLIDQRGMISNQQFQMPYQGVMQVEERKRDGVPEGMKILFLSGPLKDVEGEWNIQPGKPLGLIYRMRMDLTKTPFPPPMAASIVEQQVRTWVDAFSREMQVVKRIKE